VELALKAREEAREADVTPSVAPDMLTGSADSSTSSTKRGATEMGMVSLSPSPSPERGPRCGSDGDDSSHFEGLAPDAEGNASPKRPKSDKCETRKEVVLGRMDPTGHYPPGAFPEANLTADAAVTQWLQSEDVKASPMRERSTDLTPMWVSSGVMRMKVEYHPPK